MQKLRGAAFYISSGFKSQVSSTFSGEPHQFYGKSWAPEGWGANFLVELQWPATENQSPPWKEGLQEWDHQHFNDFPQFTNSPLTLEHIAYQMYTNLQEVLGLNTFSLKLYQGTDQYATVSEKHFPQVSVAKSFTFNSLHRHHNEQLTLEENEQLFRKCSKIHGHEYNLTIEGRGEIDFSTGTVFSHASIDDLIDRHVIDPFHGHYINEYIGNTSGETLLRYIREQLLPQLPPANTWNFFLRETQRNSFSILGSMPSI